MRADHVRDRVTTPVVALAIAAIAGAGGAASASSDGRSTAPCRWEPLRLSVETQGESTTTWIGVHLTNSGPACSLSGAATLTIEQLGRRARVAGNRLVLPLRGLIGRSHARLLRADWDNWCGSRRGLSLRVRYGRVAVLSWFSHLPACLDRSGRSRLQALLPAADGAAGAAPAKCRLAHFALALGPEISEATGQHTLALRLINRGSLGCVLDGYPTVSLSDQRGAIPFSVHHGGDQMVTPRPPSRVLVRVGGGAFVVLNQYRCDRGGHRAAKRLRLGLPRTTAADTASISITDHYRQPNYCGKGDPGSILTVSPFEPTLRDALRH